MDYETGAFVALLIWIWRCVALVVALNSTMESNLNRIGRRLSWVSLEPKEMSAGDKSRPLWWSVGKFVALELLGLAFVMLSWLAVTAHLAFFIHSRSKDAGAPDSIKEFRWKMKNIDMSFDQIIIESMKSVGQPLDSFQEVRASIIAEMDERGIKPPSPY